MRKVAEGDYTVELDARKGVREIRMIKDDGPGIAEEEQRHIFDKFYQSESSHKDEENGLGLALVKQILKISDGKISVENMPEGDCRFTVILHCCTKNQ